jgi:NAD(P)-dependent dehydrogenase (short-subunit alcohol dehydrogenase family)
MSRTFALFLIPSILLNVEPPYIALTPSSLGKPHRLSPLFDQRLIALYPRLFPSKMTAFGIKTSKDVFLEGQPTGSSIPVPLNRSHLQTSDLLFIGRYGTTEDMAGMALFLASPASAHVTGTHTLLDGGSRYGRGGMQTASVKL